MGGHPMSHSLFYAAGLYPECVGRSDLREPLNSRSPSDVSTAKSDASIGKLVKFYWGLFYDWVQISCKKIHVYDRIHLERVSPESPSAEQCESLPIAKKVNNLYLGVMPRGLFGEEFEQLSRKGPITVVSFLEDFENEEADYEIGDVVRVPSPDFKPVPVDKIQKAVEAISQSLDRENVYVHCKSGKGRSAVAVLGYVMKQLYNRDQRKYHDPNVCFEAAEKIVTESRNANTVRTAENKKAVVLLDWFKQYVLEDNKPTATAG